MRDEKVPLPRWGRLHWHFGSTGCASAGFAPPALHPWLQSRAPMGRKNCVSVHGLRFGGLRRAGASPVAIIVRPDGAKKLQMAALARPVGANELQDSHARQLPLSDRRSQVGERINARLSFT